MRVAIDAQILPGQGGVGEYTLGLVRALLRQKRHEYIVFTNPLTRQRLGTDLANSEVIRTETSPVSPLWLALMLPKTLERVRAQIYHSPAFLLPMRKVCRYCVTVHDMVYRLLPETMTLRRRQFWNIMMRNTWRQADHVFTDSLNTLQDIERITDFPSGRIEVLSAAADERFRAPVTPGESERIRRAYGLPERYFISVSTIEPRKNLELVIRGFHAYRAAGGAGHLVLVGPRGWLDMPVFKAARENGMQDLIHFTGWVPPEDLPGLYRGALALLFPSRYEGFGLPLLEAMSCGVPVITSKVSSLPEIGGDAALYIEPLEAGPLGALMRRLELEPAVSAHCRAEGLTQARKFSWQDVAVRAAQTYARLGAGTGAPSGCSAVPVLFFFDALQVYEVVNFLGDVSARLRAEGVKTFHLCCDDRTKYLSWVYGMPVDYLDLNRPLARTGGEYFSDDEISQIFLFHGAVQLEHGRLELKRRANAIAERMLAYLRENRVRTIVMWNGTLPLQMMMRLVAERERIPILYFENGYFKNTIQSGEGGVNVRNGWLTDPNPAGIWDHVMERTLRGYNVSGLPKRYGLTIKLAQFLFSFKFKTRAYQRRHPEVFVSNDFRQAFAKSFHSLTGSWWKQMRGNRQERKLPERYVFLPFQVHDDSQIVLYSKWIRNMDQFLEVVHRGLRAFCPDVALVVKEHPEDVGRKDYQHLHQRYPDVIFIRNMPVERIIRDASAVLTINSTVGFEALQQFKRVITFGEAFYNVPGIVQHVGSEDEFRALLGRGLPDVDRGLIADYLRRMQRRFIPCIWRLDDRNGVRNVANGIIAYLAARCSNRS